MTELELTTSRLDALERQVRDLTQQLRSAEANQPRRTSRNAMLSVLWGISTWTVIPLIGAPFAVRAARRAQSEIDESSGEVRGMELATVGEWLGKTQILLIPLVVLLVLGAVATGESEDIVGSLGMLVGSSVRYLLAGAALVLVASLLYAHRGKTALS